MDANERENINALLEAGEAYLLAVVNMLVAGNELEQGAQRFEARHDLISAVEAVVEASKPEHLRGRK